MSAHSSTSGLFCVASVKVKARSREKSIIVLLMQDSSPRRQDISNRGHITPSEWGRVSCGGVTFGSKVQYSRARSAPGSFRLPVNSNPRRVPWVPHAAAAEQRPQRLPPAFPRARQPGSHASSHLASLLACTNQLPSALQTNTLERRPVPKAHLVPILSASHGPRLPPSHGPQSGGLEVLTGDCAPTVPQ